MDYEEITELLRKDIKKWVLEEQKIHEVDAVPISAQDKLLLNSYFEPSILNSVKIKIVSSIPAPDFSPKTKKILKQNGFNFDKIAGLALVDCIVMPMEQKVKGLKWTSLLFHELVHCTQYKLLGISKYIELWVNGLVNNDFKYEKNPFEIVASNLHRRFEE
ncbi:MAG: hypothetical protein ABSG15_12280, partial [FCB group bacterium]